MWYGWNAGCMWSVSRHETVKARPGYKRTSPLRSQIVRCQSVLPAGEGIYFWAQEALDTLYLLSNLILKMQWEVLQIYLFFSSSVVIAPVQFSARHMIVLDKTMCVPILHLQLAMAM